MYTAKPNVFGKKNTIYMFEHIILLSHYHIHVMLNADACNAFKLKQTMFMYWMFSVAFSCATDIIMTLDTLRGCD